MKQLLLHPCRTCRDPQYIQPLPTRYLYQPHRCLSLDLWTYQIAHKQPEVVYISEYIDFETVKEKRSAHSRVHLASSSKNWSESLLPWRPFFECSLSSDWTFLMFTRAYQNNILGLRYRRNFLWTMPYLCCSFFRCKFTIYDFCCWFLQDRVSKGLYAEYYSCKVRTESNKKMGEILR